jgi:hypothetical protein
MAQVREQIAQTKPQAPVTWTRPGPEAGSWLVVEVVCVLSTGSLDESRQLAASGEQTISKGEKWVVAEEKEMDWRPRRRANDIYPVVFHEASKSRCKRSRTASFHQDLDRKKERELGRYASCTPDQRWWDENAGGNMGLCSLLSRWPPYHGGSVTPTLRERPHPHRRLL